MTKKNLITIGIILILAAVAGGFYVASRQTQNNADLTQTGAERTRNGAERNNTGQNTNAEKTEQENRIAGNQEEIDTSDWQEYCNQEYGFCVKYPQGWKIERVFNKTRTFLIEIKPRDDKTLLRFIVNVFNNKEKNTIMSLENWFNSQQKIASDYKKFKTKNDFSVNCISRKDTKNASFDEVCLLKKNNNDLVIDYSFNANNYKMYINNLPLFYNILETIK